jgi:ligand-binding sensor domain-containing protein
MKGQRISSQWRPHPLCLTIPAAMLTILVACGEQKPVPPATSAPTDVPVSLTHTPELPTATLEPPTPIPEPVPPKPGWRHYTNGNYVRELALHNGVLWAATGGGVVAWDLATGDAVKYTVLDGLTHNDANAIVVCPVPDTRIVVGTARGISLYDPVVGVWEQWTPENSGMVAEYIATLACLPDRQVLLIGSGTLGIYNAVSGEWEHLGADDGLGVVRQLAFVSSGNTLWVLPQRGVMALSPTGHTLGYCEEADQENQGSCDEGGLPDDDINSLVSAPDGTIWLGADDGLIKGDSSGWVLYSDENVASFPSEPIQSIAVASDGTLWIGSASAEICHFDPETETCLVIYDDDPGMAGRASHLILDEAGNVYYADESGEGISIFDGSDWQQLVLDEALVSNAVRTLAEDSEGMVWVVTDVGIHRIDPANENATWDLFTEENSIQDIDQIRAIYPTADGMWFSGQGLSLYNGSTWTTYTERKHGLVHDTVTAISMDSQGRLWVGTLKGLSIWDGATFTNLTEEDGLPENFITSIVAGDNVVWVSILNNGLLRFEGDEFQIFNWDNSDLPSDSVSALASNTDGKLLVGSGGDLLVFDEGQVTKLLKVEGRYHSASFSAVAVSDDGSIWAATKENSVFHFDGDAWTQLTTADGLPTHRFNAVLVDSLGTIWFGCSSEGLARFVP